MVRVRQHSLTRMHMLSQLLHIITERFVIDGVTTRSWADGMFLEKDFKKKYFEF